jgi:hypothetical protein
LLKEYQQFGGSGEDGKAKAFNREVRKGFAKLAKKSKIRLGHL